MDSLDWRLGFCDSQCGGVNGSSSITNLILIPDRTNNENNALEISYEIRTQGWVSIAKNIDSQILLETKGIGFFYKGSGAANTIELKLVMRYPDDAEDTTYGVLWNRATDTKGNWMHIEKLYDIDFTCFWPETLCQQHGDNLDQTNLGFVRTIDLAISNRPNSGDVAGSGKVALDDLAGIER